MTRVERLERKKLAVELIIEEKKSLLMHCTPTNSEEAEVWLGVEDDLQSLEEVLGDIEDELEELYDE